MNEDTYNVYVDLKADLAAATKQTEKLEDYLGKALIAPCKWQTERIAELEKDDAFLTAWMDRAMKAEQRIAELEAKLKEANETLSSDAF